jgi:predicted molibdopterin-dependent oxidoreductase YjgC
MTLDRRIQTGVRRGKRFEIEVNGQRIPAFEGETIATTLLAAGIKICRNTRVKKQPRGIYCGIGICFECRMIVNGKPNTRVCQTLATPECKVQTQQGDISEGSQQ